MAEVKFKVISVEQIKTKDGKKFNAYKTVGKGGRKMDLRFVKSCTNIPTEPCTIVVDKEDANVDTTRQYPILWVKQVKRIEKTERKSNIDDWFGDESTPVEEI